MKIKAYFLFPEADEDFLRIGDDPQSYKNLIAEVAAIKQQLRNHNHFELYYDSANVNLFLAKAETLIEDVYLADCRMQLQILFNNYCRDITTIFLRKPDCLYFNWNINCTIVNANNLLSEISESKLNEGRDKTVLINISNAFATNRDSVHVIKDAIHYNDLPKIITVPVANNDIEFIEWFSTLTNSGFSIRDKKRFKATSNRWEKQTIYLEISTGNFWYFDYFHKDNKIHYEVFNSIGINLGEANIEGVLDGNNLTFSNVNQLTDKIRHVQKPMAYSKITSVTDLNS